MFRHSYNTPATTGGTARRQLFLVYLLKLPDWYFSPSQTLACFYIGLLEDNVINCVVENV